MAVIERSKVRNIFIATYVRRLIIQSSLMHAILTNPGYYSPSIPVCGLLYEDLLMIGGLAFTQLAELRHRGAFSTVSQTFSACCVYCAKSNSPSITSLPKLWYQVRQYSSWILCLCLSTLGNSFVHSREIFSTHEAICGPASYDHWYPCSISWRYVF